MNQPVPDELPKPNGAEASTIPPQHQYLGGDVIEGDTMMEGPLGEFTDYYAGGTS
ncbi:MAG: hypothetical protein WA364_17200 [Candidatus Nitrosopolaris sp.]